MCVCQGPFADIQNPCLSTMCRPWILGNDRSSFHTYQVCVCWRGMGSSSPAPTNTSCETCTSTCSFVLLALQRQHQVQIYKHEERETPMSTAVGAARSTGILCCGMYEVLRSMYQRRKSSSTPTVFFMTTRVTSVTAVAGECALSCIVHEQREAYGRVVRSKPRNFHPANFMCYTLGGDVRGPRVASFIG